MNTSNATQASTILWVLGAAFWYFAWKHFFPNADWFFVFWLFGMSTQTVEILLFGSINRNGQVLSGLQKWGIVFVATLACLFTIRGLHRDEKDLAGLRSLEPKDLRSIAVIDSDGRGHYVFEDDPSFRERVRVLNTAKNYAPNHDILVDEFTIQLRFRDQTASRFRAYVPRQHPAAVIIEPEERPSASFRIPNGKQWLDDMRRGKAE